MHPLQGDVFGALSEAFGGPKEDFRRQNNKNEVQQSPQTAKTEHFGRPPLRKWWPFCLLNTRFTSMFELCTPTFYLLGVSFHLLQEYQHSKFSPVQEKPETVLIRKENVSSGHLVLEQFMNECLGENLHSSEVV